MRKGTMGDTIPLVITTVIGVASFAMVLTMLWQDRRREKREDLDRLNQEYADLISEEDDRHGGW